MHIITQRSQVVILLGLITIAAAQDVQRNKDFLTYGKYHLESRVTVLREQKTGMLRLPNFITDSMVLQRGANTSIWGWATPGMEVMVQFGDISIRTKADAKGRWRAVFPVLKATPVGQLLCVSSGDDIMALRDVIVGDVWLCAGQSNMDLTLQRCATGKDDPQNTMQAIIDTADNAAIRLVKLHNVSPYGPVDDLNITRWMPATPKDAGSFSAVAYGFAREIYNSTGVPIGLIDASWGGSALEPWLSLDDAKTLGAGNDYLKNCALKMAAWTPEAEQKAIVENDAKEQKYQAEMARYHEQKQLGQRPKRPLDFYWGTSPPQYSRDYCANLFNGMIHPLKSYHIAGVIWYQGESNARNASAYRESFPLLINSWRRLFGNPELPFLWVQLSSFDPGYKPEDPPTAANWAELREAQSMTTALPFTGEAISYDLGTAKDIHPKQKMQVAQRLALHALKQVYGKPDVIADGPAYAGQVVEGSKVVLSFKPGGPQPMVGEVIPYQRIQKSDGPLRGFAVAGEDQVFHWGVARIVDTTVVVSCTQVPHPVAVRYAWANYTDANLYNTAGLPAKPFRTDQWPLQSTTAAPAAR